MASSNKHLLTDTAQSAVRCNHAAPASLLLKGGGLFLPNATISGGALPKPHIPFSSSRALFLISPLHPGDASVISTGVA